MFHYYCKPEADLDRIARQGFQPRQEETGYDTLKKAQGSCTGSILVVNTRRLPNGADHVSPEAVVNLSPYRAPKPVTAAGGYVLRRGSEGPEVLVIFRRGIWDLPKGKRDKGETIEECALREVREEIGIADLRILQPAGTTEHGYDDKGAYAVKTTHWFLMETDETTFTPQAEEDIEQVTWLPWAEAVERIGFETLRDHMRGITATAAQVLGSH